MGNNEYAHRIFTQKSEADKALNTLKGILSGIIIDDVVNESEITNLKGWVTQHHELIQRNQFKEFMSAINNYIHNEIPKSEFIQDLIYLCQAYEADNYYYNGITSDLQILNGLCQGILADNNVNDEEISGLKNWLTAHKHLNGLWPYDELNTIVENILADGIITLHDTELLHAFISQFAANEKTNPVDEQLGDLLSIYAVNPKVEITGKSFCFTGILQSYKRNEAVKSVEQFGGTCTSNPSPKTNYLVVGDIGNVSWAYTAYGRKIELAMKLRKSGHRIQIIRESDFKKAIERAENKMSFHEACKSVLEKNYLSDAPKNFFAGKELFLQSSIKTNCPAITTIMGDLGAYCASLNFTDVDILIFTNRTLVEGMNQNYSPDLVELITWYNSPGKPPLILSLEATVRYLEERVENSTNDKLKDLITALKKEMQPFS